MRRKITPSQNRAIHAKNRKPTPHKTHTDRHKNDKIGTIKIISGVRKNSSSDGNYAVFVKEAISDTRGRKRWVEQPKAFWTKALAEAYIKKHT